MNIVEISLVIPVYRGAKTLQSLVLEINTYRCQLITDNYPFRILEAIFIDDGSTDGSDKVLKQLAENYSWLHVIWLSKNFGQHPATIAGILHSSGAWVVTLDEDLQHHPKYITSLLRKAVTGSQDVIYVKPKEDVHNSLFRDISSKAFKVIISKLTGNKNTLHFNSFRLIRGGIARAASAVAINQTYFDVALSWFTTRVDVQLLTMKDLRYIEEGISGYNFYSLLNHAKRLLQSSNVKLLRLVSMIGFIVMLIGFLAALLTTIIKIYYPEFIAVEGWTSIIIITLLLGGFNTFLSGLVLENISVILMQTHGKPKYFEVDRTPDDYLAKWFKLKND